MSDSYRIHATRNRTVSEYHDGPDFITHRGMRYKVQGIVLSWNVVGSDVRVWVPLKLPGEKLSWVYHVIHYNALTTVQKKRFFPRRKFTKTWGKKFKFQTP
jgi:hypothetical protein